MRSFRRTTSGLGNQHLFYKVDLIAFVEGGYSYSRSEVYSDKYTEETEDIIFWKYVFDIFLNTKKIKFKSVGSKTVVKDIALDIVSGHLQTVIVAMDNEFDEILNRRIEHPNVFYTNGYSYENDVWNQEIVKSVIEELTSVKIENNDIDIYFKKFLKTIKIAVFADGYLFKNSDSFFPRQSGHLFCINCRPLILPDVQKLAIDNRMTLKGLKKSTLYSYGKKYSIEPLKFCYGHLLADYCFQLIYHYLRKRHSISGVSKDIVYRMGIGKFFRNGFAHSEIFRYYQTQFLKNTA